MTRRVAEFHLFCGLLSDTIQADCVLAVAADVEWTDGGMDRRWMMDEINEEGKMWQRGGDVLVCVAQDNIYRCPFRCALLRVSWVEAICVLPWIRGKGLILELEASIVK